MSRSKRKTPRLGFAKSRSERWYKKWRAGRERMKERTLLANIDSVPAQERLEAELVPWDEWLTSRDGKLYYTKQDLDRAVQYGVPLWRLLGK